METSGPLISRTGLYWLTALLLLSQLPHIVHLPIWVSIVGITLVVIKTCYFEAASHYFPNYVLVIFVLLAVLAIKLHYGYFLGRDPSVAFLYLLLALKFVETRQRRDVTLLICLAGFLLFTQYFYSQTLLAALVSLPAVIAMGGSLYVLRDHSTNPQFRPTLLLVGKLLLQGIPLAALLFFVFPRFASPLWELPADARAKTGLSDVMQPGSIRELSLSHEVAFRVEFDADTPDQKDLYWRGLVLSKYEDGTWKPSSRTQRIHPAPTAASPIHYTVTLEAHNNRWLFALDRASSLPLELAGTGISEPLGHLNTQGELTADQGVYQTTRYRQSSLIADTLLDPLPALDLNTQIDTKNTRSLEFAKQLRRENANDAALVKQLLTWFNQQAFYYTLKPSLLGDTPIDEFLFDTRRGFCEHYASAFVYLLRASGIPARIVTGYQGGEMNGDYLIVRQSDAHAWTEAWINGRWQRYDPTAAVAPSRILYCGDRALSDTEALPFMRKLQKSWLKHIDLGWDAINYRWQKYIVNFSFSEQTQLFRSLGIGNIQPWQLAALVSVLAVLWALLVLNLRLTASNRQSEVDQLWGKFIRKLRNGGMPYKNTFGPTTLCQSASAHWPMYAEQFYSITAMFIQLQYGRDELGIIRRNRLMRQLLAQIRVIPSQRQLRKLRQQASS